MYWMNMHKHISCFWKVNKWVLDIVHQNIENIFYLHNCIMLKGKTIQTISGKCGVPFFCLINRHIFVVQTYTHWAFSVYYKH